jgi:predicted acyltransferase
MSATNVVSPTPGPAGGEPSRRLSSLDALRGFDMFWILGADGLVRGLTAFGDRAPTRFLAGQLSHKDWDGFAFYDLIFPLFVFIVGVSLVFSLGRTLEQEGRGAAVRRIVRRGLLLVVIGILYSGGFSNEWPNIRLLGVLQRLGLAYLFAGLAFCFLRPRGLVALCFGLLVGYWALMTFVDVPGIGTGVFEKGRNLSNWLDAQYLPGKKYDGAWDPEGLLSTLPAVGSCLLGVFAGLLLQDKRRTESEKVQWLLGAGAVGLVLGFAWSLQFPIVKKIWTSSFVLVAGGYSAILLGVFHQVIEVWGWRRWATPFVWIGMNPITVYLANNIIGFRRLAGRFAGGDVKRLLDAWVTPGMGELVLSIVALGLGVLLCWFLNRRKIYLRL